MLKCDHGARGLLFIIIFAHKEPLSLLSHSSAALRISVVVYSLIDIVSSISEFGGSDTHCHPLEASTLSRNAS